MIMKTQAVHTRESTYHPEKRLMLRAAVLTALAFFLPRAQILGGISPFAVALAASLPLKYALIAGLGAALGYLSIGVTADHLLYLLTLAAALGLKLILHRTRMRDQPASSAAITFVSFFLVNLAGFFILNLSGSDLALRLCESVIAGGISCFFHLGSAALFRRRSLFQFSRIEQASLAILLMSGLTALCSIRLYGFNLGILFGALCLLVAITKGGLTGASIGGILLAISLCLNSLDFLSVSAMLLVSGFLAGLFSVIGKLGQTAVFLACSVFSAFLLGLSLDMLFAFMAILIASGLFLSLPDRLFAFFTAAQPEEEQDYGLRSNLEQRLEFAAETIRDLQHSLLRVSKSLNGPIRPEFSTVCNKTAAAVCQSCPLRLTCWDSRYNETADAFLKLFQLYQSGLFPTAEQFNRFRQLECTRSAAVVQRMEEVFREAITRTSVSRRAAESRSFAIEQLAGVSRMLWEVSDEIGAIAAPAAEEAEVIRTIFTELAVEPQSVFCALNRCGRLEAEIYTLAGVQVDLEELRDALNRALRREFAMPAVAKISNRVRISFYETAVFTAGFGVRQAATQRDTVCGDSYEHFLDSKGNAYFILSDGMGSGKRAALDSAMTCSIIRKLIRAGLGMDSILKFVNSSLQIKSTDESLSTIDLLKLDLYTGQADFYKAGSAASFALIGHHPAKIASHSLPVGILQGVSFDHSTLKLQAGDTILLASDGVLELPEQEILSILQHGEGLPCEELAEALCRAAEQELTPHDDLTALVIRLEKGV